MCRNIKPLFNFDPPATEEEVRDAALQFVRKISGYRKPSKVNDAPFHSAVDEIAAISLRLLESLETPAQPKPRQEKRGQARPHKRAPAVKPGSRDPTGAPTQA